jgi:hypothetical protein
VLREAVDRYLRSPSSQKKPKKTGSSSKENGNDRELAVGADVVGIDADIDELEIEDKDSYGDEDTEIPAAAYVSFSKYSNENPQEVATGRPRSPPPPARRSTHRQHPRLSSVDQGMCVG